MRCFYCHSSVVLWVCCVIGMLAWSAGEALAENPLSMPERSEEVNLVYSHQPTGSIVGSWMSAGGAVADFNNNGLPDIYFPTGGGDIDSLFINQGDGTFEDEAESWGLDLIHAGNAAAAADFNNNGYIDIYVTSFGDEGDVGGAPDKNKLFKNNGDNTFTNVAPEAGVAQVHPEFHCAFGANWGDYNLNGHLDLYVATWWTTSQSDVLFRNNGDGTFTDVTVEAGVFDPSVYGFQGAFVDMNGDGWPDLLVAADFKTSRYYRNNGDGTFTDITQESGTGLDSNGMGHTIADVNNSGLFDWYVTSIYPTGHEHVGNMLYINQGEHTFLEVGKEAGVEDGAWGWGTIAVDLDNKGWVDLVEVNGRPAWPWYQVPPRLFYNNQDGTFTDIAEESGMHHGDEGRAIARLDANRDGLQDILVVNRNQPARFYRNETPNPGNWIGISFDTSTNPLIAPNGFGTHVTAEVGEKSYVRYMHGDPTYLMTSELNVHFGLGDAETIDTLTIQWPRGYVTTMHDVRVNQYLEVTAPKLADFNGDGLVDVFDLLILIGNWGEVTSAHDLKADMNNDGVVDVFDLLILISEWG